jgi:hypothetical protein
MLEETLALVGGYCYDSIPFDIHHLSSKCLRLSLNYILILTYRMNNRASIRPTTIQGLFRLVSPNKLNLSQGMPSLL